MNLFKGVSLKAKIAFWSILMAVPIILLSLGLIFKRDQMDQRLVWGCYEADSSPTIDLRPNLARVGGTRHAFAYIVEPDKEGYRLTADTSLKLERSNSGRYSFVEGKGSGWFWGLLARGSDNPRKMSAPSDFGGRFQIMTDGKTVIYTRSETRKACD